MSSGIRARRVLVLFSGPADRWDGIAAYLRERNVQVDEVDIVNRAMINQDVVDDVAWEVWKAALAAGMYYFLFCGTPCETFSHARQKQPGPPPLRSVEHPRGIPSLAGKLKEQVRTGNLFVCRTAEACTIIHNVGGGFAIENPRRWGKEPSLFAMEEIVELAGKTGARTIDLDQCCYGAVATKPTTLLYKGADFADLARRCHHPPQRWTKPDGGEHWAPHEPIVGRRNADGQWATKALGAYPADFNWELAKRIAAAAPSRGVVLTPARA